MDRNDPAKRPGTITTLHKTLWAEIHTERERHRELYASGTTGRITLIILGVAILINIFLFFENPLYPLMFTSASFFLFMFYFVTLLIPPNLKETPLPQTEISRYLVRLRENGIIVSTRRFTRVFLNAFFINCRPLFYGFALIFSIDIVLVIAMAAQGVLSSSSTVIILMESAAIILFYFLVWRLEPYTIEFFSGVSGVKERLIQKRVPEPVVSSLFFLSAALALVGILSTLVLLPGMSVNNILSVTELKQLSHFFLAIGVILITQYFIMRYIHGNTSRDLLARFSQGKAACLFHQIELTGQTGRSSSGAADEDAEAAAVCRAAELLLESQIYQVDKKTLFGTFPVYIVNPDFSWVFFPAVPHDGETPLG
ncbi:MAG: hypothetical protein WBC56_01035 [Methanoregula sp.]|uniref:hypothetical protein n=1 Tax=Methanoregula sp. TaxID=2052170 RepID=UPI003C73F8E4